MKSKLLNMKNIMKLYLYFILSYCSMITESDNINLEHIKRIVIEKNDITLFKEEKVKLNFICNKLLNLEYFTESSEIKIIDLTVNEAKWLQLYFDIISNYKIESNGEVTIVIELIANNIFSLAFISDYDLINSLYNSVLVIYSKINRHGFQPYELDTFIPLYFNELYEIRAFEFIKNLDFIVSDNTDNRDYYKELDSRHKLYVIVLIFIFSSSYKNYFSYFNENLLTICLYILSTIELDETIKLLSVLSLLYYTEILPKKIIISYNNFEYKRISTMLIYKLISSIHEHDLTFLDQIRATIKLKENKIEACSEIMDVVKLFIENDNMKKEMLLYFDINDEETFLSYCVRKLFCDISLSDFMFLQQHFLIHSELYKNINLYYNVLNFYILYSVEYLFYLFNIILNDDVEKTIRHIDNIIHIMFKFIVRFYPVNITTSIYPNLDMLSSKYVNTDVGLKKRNDENNEMYSFIPLHVTRNTRNNIHFYRLNMKKIYLQLMSFAFIRNDISNFFSDDKRITMCYHRILALKIILKVHMDSLGLYVCKDFDNIDQDVINCINSNIFNNVYMNTILSASLDNFEVNDQNNMTLNEYLIHHCFLNNDYSRIDENIDDEVFSIVPGGYTFIDIDVTGGEIFSQSLKTVKDLIKNYNGKLPNNIIFSIKDGSVAEGDGVMVSWIQNISSKCIDASEKYLFIKSKNEKYIPYSLSDKAFLKNEDAYKFIGHVLGLAIRIKSLFAVEFEDFVYDILLGNSVNLESFIRDEYSHYFNSNIQDLEYVDILNQLKLYLIDYSNGEFEQTDIIILSDENFNKWKISGRTNINEIIKKIFFIYICHNIFKSIFKIRDGLLQVINDVELAKYNNYTDFKNAIYGDYFIDVMEWLALTDVKVNNDEEKQTAELFWKYIEMMTMDNRKTILKFWTGTTNLPKNTNDKIFVLEINNNFKFDVRALTCLKTLYLKTKTDLKEFDLLFGTANEFDIDANLFNIK